MRAMIVAVLIVLAVVVLGGQAVKPVPVSVVSDWTDGHVIFPQSNSIAVMINIQRDPRYWQQWWRRFAAAASPVAGSAPPGATLRPRPVNQRDCLDGSGPLQKPVLFKVGGGALRRAPPSLGERTERLHERKVSSSTLEAVLISPTNYRPGGDKTEHLVVTLSTHPWCTSSWQPIYYRIWQARFGSGEPKLLLDENEIGFIAEPIQASVWPEDVLIEYAVSSIDAGVHNRRQRT